MNGVNILVSPLATDKISFANRVVMAPMARNYAPNFVPDENLATYYARRAEHGVGLIITEASFIDHPVANGYKGAPAIFGEKALAGYQAVVERVHAHGGKIFCQLWHMGAERPVGGIPHPELPSVSPSGILAPGVQRGKALDLVEIAAVQASFARAAANARRVGFDGVEIHGAHGYLIDAFLSEATNQRTDAYGGSFDKRLRFAVEVIERVRQAVGEDFPISFRTSQWKSQDYGAKIYRNPGELEAALSAFVRAGVDIIHCSTRRFWEAEFEGSDLSLAAWSRKVSGKPVIAVGSVTLHGDFTQFETQGIGLRGMAGSRPTANLDRVEQALERGDFDLIAVGRAMLANPDWLVKVKAGQIAEISAFSPDHIKVLY
jgi:2,4-dienoyl-CoA reductase-like NADH-dependent reductase (Old Yellow Enzyme family)